VVAYPVRGRVLERRLPPPFAALTLGGWSGAALLVGRYGPGSSLEYDEFAAIGLARLGGRWGPFVHAISVDLPASLEGGRAVWDLPKTLARFEWTGPAEVRVELEGGGALRLRLEPFGPALPLAGRGRLLNGRERGPALVPASFRGRGRLARTYLEMIGAGGREGVEPPGPALGLLLEGSASVRAPVGLTGILPG
jgi:hypothetical protein